MANEPVNPPVNLAGAPVATASVGPSTGAPKGYMWEWLASAKTPDDVAKVREFAKAHGYSPEGQFMQAIADRLAGEK